MGGLGEEMEGSCNRDEHTRRFEKKKASKVGTDHALGEESHERMRADAWLLITISSPLCLLSGSLCLSSLSASSCIFLISLFSACSIHLMRMPAASISASLFLFQSAPVKKQHKLRVE